MAEEKKSPAATKQQAEDLQRLTKRLDMLDTRLDNIDSMVTAVAERVMSRPVTLNVTCSHCGKEIEIAVIGSELRRRYC